MKQQKGKNGHKPQSLRKKALSRKASRLSHIGAKSILLLKYRTRFLRRPVPHYGIGEVRMTGKTEAYPKSPHDLGAVEGPHPGPEIYERFPGKVHHRRKTVFETEKLGRSLSRHETPLSFS